MQPAPVLLEEEQESCQELDWIAAARQTPSQQLVPGQLVQKTLPTDFANLPGSQLSQTVAAKAAAKVPSAHLVQVADPSTGENMPALQSSHADIDVAPSAATEVPARHACLSVEPPVQ